MRFSIEHIGLAATDPTALKDWYVRALSARVLFQTDQSSPAYFLEFPGGAQIEIYKSDRSTSETSINSLTGWRHLALHVESIEPARDELISRGIQFTEPIKPAGGGGRILFFKDPDGNLLHLLERPADSPLSKTRSVQP